MAGQWALGLGLSLRRPRLGLPMCRSLTDAGRWHALLPANRSLLRASRAVTTLSSAVALSAPTPEVRVAAPLTVLKSGSRRRLVDKRLFTGPPT